MRFNLGSHQFTRTLLYSDLYAVTTYTGNGSGQQVVNGLNMNARGGMVMLTSPYSNSSRIIVDTSRGGDTSFALPSTSAETINAETINSWNTNGFSLGSSTTINNNGTTYRAISFSKAPNFFDIVTYTGDGSTYGGYGREVNHNLGTRPGMIWIKRRDSTSNWAVSYCAGLPGTTNARTGFSLNSTAGYVSGYEYDPSQHSSSYFNLAYVATHAQTGMNDAGATYVAYLFANDTTTNGAIRIGSYTGNGSSTGPSISLGWTPQSVLIKRINGTGEWPFFHTINAAGDARTDLNAAIADDNGSDLIDTISGGFQIANSAPVVNQSGDTYLYMAIRGP